MAARPSFGASSQGLRWTFTQEDLAELRLKTNADAAAKLRAAGAGEGGHPAPLSAEEELDIVRRLLQSDLDKVCAKIPRLDLRTRQVAAVLLARAFLRRSVMDVTRAGALHPRIVMCTLLLVAAKAEELKVVDAHKIAKAAKASPEAVVALEPDVLAALDFDLCVHTPQDALDALMRALREGPSPPPRADWDAVAARCHQHLDEAMRMSDACFLFSPQQLAFAVLEHHGGGEVGSALRAMAAERGAPVNDAALTAFLGTEMRGHSLEGERAVALRDRLAGCHKLLLQQQATSAGKGAPKRDRESEEAANGEGQGLTPAAAGGGSPPMKVQRA
mmetsp:Transcript_14133/g.47874  ORF Transcript_14133/g.47874 Transcript_14133/m.47874 type:complete len:332 (-) Transcript_14133:37-1032(-)